MLTPAGVDKCKRVQVLIAQGYRIQRLASNTPTPALPYPIAFRRGDSETFITIDSVAEGNAVFALSAMLKVLQIKLAVGGGVGEIVIPDSYYPQLDERLEEWSQRLEQIVNALDFDLTRDE